ncbi:MAG: hypothetical protein AAF449_07000 [Myxococcota bacterium]
MAAPAEIPHADEALKTLVQRFKASPGSSAFTTLAAALLARGHAAEALRITEHGLQLVPGSVEGRVERAAALLGQGRPRMAYVELLRALAIEPQHRRAQRLLGKAFVDSGAPERAAALLAQRSSAIETDDSQSVHTPPSPKNLAASLISDLTDNSPTTETEWQAPQPHESVLPDLFSALTKDLGLGGAVPEASPQRRVEVTQIIRRKARPRPPRSASELAEIDGPIVDTSQPTPAIDTNDEPVPTITAKEKIPLFPQSPDFATLSLDDEPLFQEHMPFAVRPVKSPTDDLPTVEPQQLLQSEITATHQEHRPAGPPTRPPRGPESGSQRPLRPDPDSGELTDPNADVPASRAATVPNAGSTGTPGYAPTSGGIVRSPPPAAVLESNRRRAPRTPPAAPAVNDSTRYDGGGVLVERHRGRHGARLEIESPPRKRGRIALALTVAILIIVYFVGWPLIFGDTLSVWWKD